MKKLLLFSAIVVLSVSQLRAQSTVVPKVDKLVYPGVVFGTTLNSNSCYNISPQSVSVSNDSGMRFFVSENYFFSVGNREIFMIQSFSLRNGLLDYLLA